MAEPFVPIDPASIRPDPEHTHRLDEEMAGDFMIDVEFPEPGPDMDAETYRTMIEWGYTPEDIAKGRRLTHLVEGDDGVYERPLFRPGVERTEDGWKAVMRAGEEITLPATNEQGRRLRYRITDAGVLQRSAGGR